jgi:hypothetical protein
MESPISGTYDIAFWKKKHHFHGLGGHVVAIEI